MTENKQEKIIKISEDKLLEYIKANSSYKKTLYLDLGVKIVRLICYSEQFIPHIQKQFTYTLLETSKKYDTTIILWHEPQLEDIYSHKQLFQFIPKTEVHEGLYDFVVYDTNMRLYVPSTNTYYHGVKNLETEEFVKDGHAFVQVLYKILKTENSNLVHGACVGLDNKGVLFCARGQRGKSTLTVLSLLSGFEYVSDDYLTLEKEGDNLYAHPIYSIITLSPRMYNEMYDKLEGTRFISNNVRKDKYVINIANLHSQFRKKYPIKICMFPEIVSDDEPSISECSQQQKGQAITHIVHSTVMQMMDVFNAKTMKKMVDMVNGFKFYRINLCNDIYKNTECLKQFLKEYKDD